MTASHLRADARLERPGRKASGVRCDLLENRFFFSFRKLRTFPFDGNNNVT